MKMLIKWKIKRMDNNNCLKSNYQKNKKSFSKIIIYNTLIKSSMTNLNVWGIKLMLKWWTMEPIASWNKYRFNYCPSSLNHNLWIILLMEKILWVRGSRIKKIQDLKHQCNLKLQDTTHYFNWVNNRSLWASLQNKILTISIQMTGQFNAIMETIKVRLILKLHFIPHQIQSVWCIKLSKKNSFKSIMMEGTKLL